MRELDTRLDAAVAKRDILAAEVQRIEGRLEEARTALENVEKECRDKGVEPDQIDRTIQQLSDKYKHLVEQLEKDVSSADEALAPFLKET